MPALPLLCAAAVLMGLSLSAPAQACSVRSGYRTPSAIDLTAQADTIVLVKVGDGGPSEEVGFRKARLVYLRSLKGPPPRGPIAFDDTYLAPADIPVTRSNPSELSEPNPDVFNGGCNRHLFREGMILVAFLKNESGRWTVYAPPFSRALEDVPGRDALWVKAVSLYVRATSVPRDRWKAMLHRLRLELAAGAYGREARLLYAELGKTAASIRPKPTLRRRSQDSQIKPSQ